MKGNHGASKDQLAVIAGIIATSRNPIAAVIAAIAGTIIAIAPATTPRILTKPPRGESITQPIISPSHCKAAAAASKAGISTGNNTLPIITANLPFAISI